MRSPFNSLAAARDRERGTSAGLLMACQLIAAAFVGGTVAAAEPVIDPATALRTPVLFNTPEADRILAQLQVFPQDNWWNIDVSRWPVYARSPEMIASVGASGGLRYNLDMNFVLV